MLLLFCLDPLASRQPDELYRREADAATQSAIPRHLIDHDGLVTENDRVWAVRRVPVQLRPTLGVYRGWMTCSA
jgi:hypothetical protein